MAEQEQQVGVMRDVEIAWDELVDAFENADPEVVYFLDRTTGEVFFVPVDYEDDSFWEEIDSNSENIIPIPGFDYEQERVLVHEFIREMRNNDLKQILEKSFIGKRPYGRLDEILSFYPEEMEKLTALKDEMTAERIRQWLEEHDIYAREELF